jgi:hypothetical protein
MGSRDCKRSVAYPFTGSMVGGTYVVAASQARPLSLSAQWEPTVYLPLRGPNATVFEQNEVFAYYYGLRESEVVSIHSPGGILGNARTLPVHMHILWTARRLLNIVILLEIRTL